MRNSNITFQLASHFHDASWHQLCGPQIPPCSLEEVWDSCSFQIQQDPYSSWEMRKFKISLSACRDKTKKNNQNAELCTSEVEQQASYNSGHQKDLEA